MKRLFLGIISGVVISSALHLSIVALAQDRITAFVQPLIVDVQQAIPVRADVVVPLDNGATVTTTVPLALNLSFQVSLSGVVNDSVQVVDEIEPLVTTVEPTKVPVLAVPSNQMGELTYAEICVDAPKELTDIKLKKYHESLIGSEILWTGYIYDVIEVKDGTYSVQVSNKSKEDSFFFSRSIEIVGVPVNVAADLDVNQEVSYSGKIIAIEEFISDCNPVKVEYRSITP